MKKCLLILSHLFIVFIVLSQDNHRLKVYSFNDLEPRLHLKNDTTYLINFWATWCRPCVDELPVIEEIAERYNRQKFKVLLVSLDFPSQIDSRLRPFIQKQNIQSEVVILDDPDSNEWIDKVSGQWSGAIPASLIYNSEDRLFYESSFDYKTLDSIINVKIKNP